MKGPAYVIFYSAIVALLFTGGIMAVHQAALGTIRQNEKLFEYKALAYTLELGDPDALSDGEIIDLVESRTQGYAEDDRILLPDPETGKQYRLFIAYDRPADEPDAEVTGWAFDIEGVGFWAKITGVLGLDRDMRTINGVAFLSHSETPGLGGRITTDDEWLAKWEDTQVRPRVPNGKFVYIAKSVTPGTEEHHVDAITGATGTSAAIEKFLNEDIEGFFRAVRSAAQRGEFPGPVPEGLDEPAPRMPTTNPSQ